MAIEPFFMAMEKLRKNFGWRCLFTRFLPVECAASDVNGRTFLFLDRDGKRCSGSGDTIEPVFNYRPASIPGMELITHHNSGDGEPRQLVESRRLDTVMNNLRINSVDLLKIDVEGAEFKVLRGAHDTLHITRRVVVELHDRERKKELENRLQWCDFKTTWLDPDHILGERIN